MRFNTWSSILAAVFVAAAIPAFSQVQPAAATRTVPLVVGAGYSDFNVDFGGGRRKDGGTIWADWTITQMPRMLQGIGVEAIARDISLNSPQGLTKLRYDTAGGGLIYHYLRPRNIRPYAKFLGQFGSISFPSRTSYSHDTRAFYAFGGGGDIHAWKGLWVRADYEYQMWWGLFGRGHALTPNGVTIGPEYDFGTPGGRGR